MKTPLLVLTLAVLMAGCTYKGDGPEWFKLHRETRDNFVKQFGINNVECNAHENVVSDYELKCVGTKKRKVYKFSCTRDSCTVEM